MAEQQWTKLARAGVREGADPDEFAIDIEPCGATMDPLRVLNVLLMLPPLFVPAAARDANPFVATPRETGPATEARRPSYWFNRKNCAGCAGSLVTVYCPRTTAGAPGTSANG